MPSTLKLQAETGEVYKFTAIPLFDKQGNIIGIAESALNAQALGTYMQQLLNEKTMLMGIYLYDTSGIVLLANTREGAITQIHTGEVSNDSQIFESLTQNQIVFGESRDKRQFCYLPIQRNRDNAYVLMLEVNTEYYKTNAELFRKAITDISFIFWISIILMIALFIIMLLIMLQSVTSYVKKHVIVPIEKLCYTANAVAIGEAVQNDLPDSDDEIGFLYQAFGSVTASILKQSQLIAKVAKGDFTQSLEKRSDNDLLTGNMNNMTELLSNMILKIHQVSLSVADLAKKGADYAQKLDNQAKQQKDQLSDMLFIAEQIGKQADQNALEAQQANTMTTQSGVALQIGVESSKMAAAAIDGIAEKSRHLVALNTTVEDVAAKTNILALNASIEAARAGTAGKTFSVVAEQVKVLAIQSQHTAQNSQDLIQEMCVSVNSGANIVKKSVSDMNEIAESAMQVTKLLEEITHTGTIQSNSIFKITDMMKKLYEVTDQTAFFATQSNEFSEELLDQAQKMQELVQQFQVKQK